MHPITCRLRNNKITVISIAIISHAYCFFTTSHVQSPLSSGSGNGCTLLLSLAALMCNRIPEIILQAKRSWVPVEKSLPLVPSFDHSR